MNTNTNEPIGETRKARFREAYERTLPEMQALPDTERAPINIDIPSAVTTALGVFGELSALRERVAGLPEFDAVKFDKLETYALAAWQAHALYVAASTPLGSLAELAQRAATSRELLFSDAVALAKRGLLDGQRLKALKGPVGYKNLAVDLGVMVAMLRQRWDSIAGRTALSLAELDEAEAVADELITAVGQREQARQVVAAAADTRQRAYTLFVDAYDQARRAASYLRWNADDVEDVIPSLYAGRQNGNHRRKADRDASGDAAASTLTSVTSSGTTRAPNVPTESSVGLIAAPVLVGHPGGEAVGT